MTEEKLPVSNEEDLFNEVFFKEHGVGDVPADPELEAIGYSLDHNNPSLKEIRFCRFVISGDTPTVAYKKAFEFDGTEYNQTTYYRNALKLLKRPRVAKKLFELKQQLEEYENESMASIIQELNEDRQLARDLGQPGAAIQAVKTKANLLGLDNATSVTTNISVNLSDNQKEQLFNRIKGRIGTNSVIPDDTKREVIDAEYEDITNDET